MIVDPLQWVRRPSPDSVRNSYGSCKVSGDTGVALDVRVYTTGTMPVVVGLPTREGPLTNATAELTALKADLARLQRRNEELEHLSQGGNYQAHASRKHGGMSQQVFSLAKKMRGRPERRPLQLKLRKHFIHSQSTTGFSRTSTFLRTVR
jgi:hypothetical protein